MMDPADRLFAGRIPWVWILIAAGALLYIPFIGGVHLFDWDEINFAEISREMIISKDYLNIQINFQPFFEKPPLFFWLQTVCMNIFGINEFSARLPNAIGGIITLVLLFKIGSKWIDRRFGVFWALSYMGSILPLLYHKSGIIDPWFNLFIFAGILCWIEGSKSNSQTIKWFAWSGILSGLAILTKGPVGPLLIGLTILVMRFWSNDAKYLKLRAVSLFILGNILIAGIWFGINWFSNGPDFILAFIKYQVELLSQSVAGHSGFPGYHFAVALFGVFPASLFAIGALRKKQSDEQTDAYHLRLWMIILTGIVLLLFSVVQSKIVHYSSMIYYPISFLSAWTICRLLDQKFKWGFLFIISAVISLIILIALVMLPLAGQQIEWLKSNFSLDAFSLAAMNAPVQWGLIDYLPAAFFLLTISLFIILWRRLKQSIALLILFFGMGIFINLSLIFFIGKIEAYTQRAAIEFCESKSGQDVEMSTMGFKSYLHYFYTQKPLPNPLDTLKEKPQFIILREDKRDRLLKNPDLKILYEKNGFIFLEKVNK